MTLFHKSILIFLLLFVPSVAHSASYLVLESSGSVKYRAKNSLKKIDVKAKDSLDEGGKILIKKGGKLKLQSPNEDVIEFKDKCYINLSKLSKDGDTQKLKVDLFQGKVHCNVQKLKGQSEFMIKTPSAVAGVRGTSFACLVSPKGVTDVFVLEGAVAVQDVEANFGAVEVKAGKAARVKSGSTPRVFSLAKSNLKKVIINKVKSKKSSKTSKSNRSGSSSKSETSTDAEGEKEGEESSSENNEDSESSEGESSDSEEAAETEGEETNEGGEDLGGEESTEIESDETLETEGTEIVAEGTDSELPEFSAESAEIFFEAIETDFEIEDINLDDALEILDVISDEISDIIEEILDESTDIITEITEEELNSEVDIQLEINTIAR